MEFESNYEIAPTADFIHTNNFTRVALQFPDELLKDSVRVVSALRAKLRSLRKPSADLNDDVPEVSLFVMADTAYGSCCVDEVGASHVDADCVVHYGHTCLSPTTTLPAFFVFGKARISVLDCVNNLSHYALENRRRVLVLFGLDYAHSIQHIKEEFVQACGVGSKPEVQYANVMCSVMNPSKDRKLSNELPGPAGSLTDDTSFGTTSNATYSIGGLVWKLPEGRKMEDYLLFWIGSNNSAFANIVLTYNGCEIVRYDASECSMVTDLSQQRRILKRRYYLMEKAKDANIVGILVGTLGVAGYLNVIHQMKELITGAGKKVYTLVMGRPNPAKLANFPECDVFIYVSCSQTALLDSKEYLAPVITPFEAMIAFNRGCEWTGAYVMEFRDLISSSPVDIRIQSEEARFSFIQGGYVEDFHLQDDIVLIDETQEGVNAKLNLWREVLESKGLRLSRSKTEYMECKFNATGGPIESGVRIGDQEIPKSDRFRYLGSILQKNGDLDGDLNHRIQAGWMKWKSASGVLCDRRMPLKLKGKFYKTAIRPALLYGTECWAVKHQHVHKMGVAEIRMLRWMCGHTIRDKIRNDEIRGKVGVTEIEGKMRENRLRWFGHVQRRPTSAPVRRCDYGTEVQGRRGRGRPSKTLEETLRKDLRVFGFNGRHDTRPSTMAF